MNLYNLAMCRKRWTHLLVSTRITSKSTMFWIRYVVTIFHECPLKSHSQSHDGDYDPRIAIACWMTIEKGSHNEWRGLPVPLCIVIVPLLLDVYKKTWYSYSSYCWSEFVAYPHMQLFNIFLSLRRCGMVALVLCRRKWFKLTAQHQHETSR